MHENHEILALIIVCEQQPKILIFVFPFILLERVTWLHKINVITNLKWESMAEIKTQNSEHWKTLCAFGDVINE